MQEEIFSVELFCASYPACLTSERWRELSRKTTSLPLNGIEMEFNYCSCEHGFLRLCLIPLHSSISPEEQYRVFLPPEAGERKVTGGTSLVGCLTIKEKKNFFF